MVARLQPQTTQPRKRLGGVEAREAAARLAERQSNFCRAERLSLSERTALPKGFDPGPDYDIN